MAATTLRWRPNARRASPMRPDLAVVSLPVTALLPYAENARTHSPTQVAQIAASIAEFGFVNPVLVDGEGVLIAGHGRIMAGEPAILDGDDRSFAEVATARLSAATQQSGHQRGSPTPETPEPQKCPIANLKNRKHERS